MELTEQVERLKLKLCAWREQIREHSDPDGIGPQQCLMSYITQPVISLQELRDHHSVSSPGLDKFLSTAHDTVCDRDTLDCEVAQHTNMAAVMAECIDQWVEQCHKINRLVADSNGQLTLLAPSRATQTIGGVPPRVPPQDHGSMTLFREAPKENKSPLGKLTCELFDMVLHHLLPGGQGILIRFDPRTKGYTFRSPPQSTLLQVCSEFRNFALRHLKRLFAGKDGFSLAVYIKLERDVLYFDFPKPRKQLREFVSIYPEACSAHMIAVPEVEYDSLSWRDFHQVQRILLVRRGTKMWDEQQYRPIRFEMDECEERIFTEQRYNRMLSEETGSHVPCVHSVFVYYPASVVYDLAKDELARVERERRQLPGCWGCVGVRAAS